MRIFILVICLLLPLWAQAANQRVVPDIQNTTCSLCVVSVSQALHETDGVIRVKSSLKTRQIETIVPEGLPIDTLLNVIARTDYTVALNRIERQ